VEHFRSLDIAAPSKSEISYDRAIAIFAASRFKTVSQFAQPCGCDAEEREASRLFSRLRRRNSSPEFLLSKVEGAQNDIKTQSLRENSMNIKAGTDLVVTGKLDSPPWLRCLNARWSV